MPARSVIQVTPRRAPAAPRSDPASLDCGPMLASTPAPPHVGIFDSGVGGFSVLRTLHATMPGCRLTYVADNKFLDFKSETMQGWGYTVFGKVVAGQDVVDKIAKVRTGRVGWYDDVPTEDVVIEKAEVI